MITNKTQFRELWLLGSLGNTPRIWKRYEDIPPGQIVSFRMHEPSSQYSLYNVKYDEIPGRLQMLAANGIKVSGVWFNESMPDDTLILQGEYIHSGLELNRELTYCRAPIKMKEIFKLPHTTVDNSYYLQFASGLKTNMILRASMNENDWSDFNELIDKYPEHAIEFGIYDHCVGVLPHRRMIIWEVRSY